jgi:hypothetical protein
MTIATKIAFIVLCVLSSGAMADTDKDIMNMSMEEIKAERKQQVEEKMDLTAQEFEIFWPLYDEFQVEREKLEKNLFTLVIDYSKQHDNVTDEKAAQLLDASLSLEEQRIKLKRDFIEKNINVLPASKIARYIQIENKFWAVVLYHLSLEVPIINK